MERDVTAIDGLKRSIKLDLKPPKNKTNTNPSGQVSASLISLTLEDLIEFKEYSSTRHEHRNINTVSVLVISACLHENKLPVRRFSQ